jgi:KipI family sensor histidine kinase inhibitor
MFRMPRVVDASDRAFLVLFDDGGTPEAGLSVRILHDWLRRERPAAVVDLHPAYQTLLVTYDPLLGDPLDLAADIERRAGSLSAWRAPASRSFVVPVHYGGDDGPDLEDVSRLTGLSAEEVIAAHSGASYEVRFIGFSPGFPYLGGLPERLRTPRRDTPRRSVPAGSVAIAGAQAGIYPVRSPGGWNVIGKTDFVLFDQSGAMLSPGDRVRFEPAGAK